MILHTLFQNIALAISAYSDELYTGARKLNSTGIVGNDARISTDGESLIGQIRWYKPLTANINVPSLTVATEGSYTDVATDVATFIKAARTFGAQQVNLQSLASKEDGLQKIARDFMEVRSQDEHDNILATLKGVAGAEVARGAGIVAYTTDADAAGTGFYVDLNAAGLFGAVVASAATARKLIDSSATGAAKGERLFKAVGAAFKDYEPDFMYMITSPETLAELRAASLVDPVTVVDGNLSFQTILGGKFRLILTRAAQGDLSAHANVNDFSTKTTFIVKPGSISFTPMPMAVPVGIQRDEKSYTGGGSTTVLYRWGYVVHPIGYHWAGATGVFASVTDYGTAASWTRKSTSALNLGILPIFHG
jgi:hypothetical protein